MLGHLFAETIEDIDMGPVQALTIVGATAVQLVTDAILSGLLPSLVGIALFRFDENVRSSLVLGFVGAGGIGFLILTSILVTVVERVSAAVRARLRGSQSPSGLTASQGSSLRS